MAEKRTPKVPRRPPVPDVFRASVDRAKARTLARRHGPIVELVRDGTEQQKWAWPFDDTDEGQEWTWLVLDAFGTRNETVAGVFLNHLVQIVRADYDDERQEWVPDDGELIALLNIVAAHRPKNEAQAALAAQMAATHLIFMKLAKRAADYPYDSRTVSSFTRVALASAAQFETMATIKGKRRSTRQQIIVTHERHIHNHQHVHVEGGASGNDDQAHASEEPIGRETSGGAAVPCSKPNGSIVRLSGGEGQKGLPHARRRSRVGRTEG